MGETSDPALESTRARDEVLRLEPEVSESIQPDQPDSGKQRLGWTTAPPAA